MEVTHTQQRTRAIVPLGQPLHHGWRNFETLESFISKEERIHPHSRGSFSDLLRNICLAAKIIQSKVNRAGLLNVLGARNSINVQGEQQMKLDVLANETMLATLQWMPYVAGLASEEEEDVIRMPPQPTGMDAYVVLFDPLDGSSNIDANVNIGTIFSIQKRITRTGPCELTDFLQPGFRQVAAGYVVYGSSTVFVYTTGDGVHGFTLDPEVGEFVLSHPYLRIPDVCKCFSTNDANYGKWAESARRFADHIRYGTDERYQKTSSRYIGSLVADFHRNLLYGGIFIYPADSKYKNGKLRLLYECSPLAFIAEQAGGGATTGYERIMDVQPRELHQRVPLIIGNRKEVNLYEEMVRRYDGC